MSMNIVSKWPTILQEHNRYIMHIAQEQGYALKALRLVKLSRLYLKLLSIFHKTDKDWDNN
jgi:hypothetical protein